jgi:lipoprotein-anchoring transpeptidase ErfK/SrfK
MSKQSRIEEQIQQFYDSVPNVGDALPLKDYLLKHEDSRMAWYLLGKQYEGNGEQAKATYCFAQAGDIFTAFEGKPAPELPKPASAADKETSHRKAIIIWTTVFVILLIAIGLGVKALIHKNQELAVKIEETEGTVKSTATPSQIGGSTPASPIVIPVHLSSSPGLIAGASDPEKDVYEVLGELLTNNEIVKPKLLVKAPKLGAWTDWVKSGKPLATVISDEKSGASSVNWYDSQSCHCKPQDASDVQKMVQGWKPIQEEKIVMRSAMIRYQQSKGKWPASPEALTGNYPANTIAGWSENMTQWFEELKEVLENKKDGKIPKSVGWPEQPAADNSDTEKGDGTPSGLLTPLTEQPLAIIVDKDNHRLAVVSGDVLLRNYEVGLGGDRTPEGKFVITEKVKNPNGRSTGAFGSRGMTLSDSRYGIHGTNHPDSMGKDESLGCVRMKKEDLEELYDLVPIGTPVTITKGGLPNELRSPPERFRLTSTQDETNPHKIYDWLN